MKQAGELNPGGMLAALGADIPTAEQACLKATQQTGKVVGIANDNCPGQVVISGEPEALAAAAEFLRESGIRRLVPLAVSIAGHSSLLDPAQTRLNQALLCRAANKRSRDRGRSQRSAHLARTLDREYASHHRQRDHHIHRTWSGRGPHWIAEAHR